jgi:hypothetical protein
VSTALVLHESKIEEVEHRFALNSGEYVAFSRPWARMSLRGLATSYEPCNDTSSQGSLPNRESHYEESRKKRRGETIGLDLAFRMIGEGAVERPFLAKERS